MQNIPHTQQTATQRASWQKRVNVKVYQKIQLDAQHSTKFFEVH